MNLLKAINAVRRHLWSVQKPITSGREVCVVMVYRCSRRGVPSSVTVFFISRRQNFIRSFGVIMDLSNETENDDRWNISNYKVVVSLNDLILETLVGFQLK